MSNETKATKKKKGLPFSIITIVLCACIMGYFVFAIIGEFAEYRANTAERSQKETVLAEQNAENEIVEEEISEGDIDELAEQYAREKGYIMPDEKVCIDITPGT